jgi:hypothetical protein
MHCAANLWKGKDALLQIACFSSCYGVFRAAQTLHSLRPGPFMCRATLWTTIKAQVLKAQSKLRPSPRMGQQLLYPSILLQIQSQLNQNARRELTAIGRRQWHQYRSALMIMMTRPSHPRSSDGSGTGTWGSTRSVLSFTGAVCMNDMNDVLHFVETFSCAPGTLSHIMQS